MLKKADFIEPKEDKADLLYEVSIIIPGYREAEAIKGVNVEKGA